MLQPQSSATRFCHSMERCVLIGGTVRPKTCILEKRAVGSVDRQSFNKSISEF